MHTPIRWTRALQAGVAALALAAVAPGGPAGGAPKDDEEEIPFEEATLFFELNDTDGDLGFHGLVDGDAWKRLQIEDPKERTILFLRAKGALRMQGLTELFFESAEPPFSELPPEDFFARFPAGTYEVEGSTIEREQLESEVEVSHVLPAPPEGITLSGEPAVENCDVVPLPVVSAPVVIDWDDVVDSHPTIGQSGDIEVAKYTLVVEREEPELLIFSVELPPDVTSFEVPEDFTDLGEEFKFEIQVRATNGNQTVVESCFELE